MKLAQESIVTNRTLPWIAALLSLLLGAAAFAQDDLSELSDEQLIKDIIHYQRIVVPDLAAAAGQELMSRAYAPREFVEIVGETGEEAAFLDALGGLLREPRAEPTAASLLRLHEEGRLAKARDPEEIARNIQLLAGNQRNRIFGRQRLLAAKEYAVPQLLEHLLAGRDPGLRTQIQNLLIDMGEQAVIPLSVALLDVNQRAQEQIANILGRIQLPTAIPFLAELGQTTDDDGVRRATQEALGRIRGGERAADAANAYRSLGEVYYDEQASVTSFPGEGYQLLWEYRPEVGLLMRPIDTTVYHEAMAMRMSERSLMLRERPNGAAVSLWVASNLRREIEQPDGYTNPAYPEDRPDAMYFAVITGAEIAQSVLARALRDEQPEPMLARRAIEALRQTAGGNTLWTGADGRPQPLLAALSYPTRRIQYEAAMALGAAQPQNDFNGSQRVAPILASAVYGAGERFALVVAADAEAHRGLRDIIEGAGYTVGPFARTFEDVQQQINTWPSVDLVVINQSRGEAGRLVSQARSIDALLATPILALTNNADYRDLERDLADDRAVAVRLVGIDAVMMRQAVTDLTERTYGGAITEAEAREYASASLDLLRDLAVSRNQVINVTDTSGQLVAALKADALGHGQRIAEVLGWVATPEAQQEILEAGLRATGEQRLAYLATTSASARRHGDMLTDRHRREVFQMARGSDEAEATAAAALLGALNIESEDLAPLILGQNRQARQREQAAR
jgi:hypothetical protein